MIQRAEDCLDYKAVELGPELQRVCPNGIDIYFEKVGGDVPRAVAPLLNTGGRVPICGYVSHYNAADITKVVMPQDILKEAPNVPEHRFFVVTEWMERWPKRCCVMAFASTSAASSR